MAKFYCPTKISENISETPEGYLLCLAVPIARTGIMEYGEGETPLEVGDDGIVYVSRDAAEVFRKQTIASVEGKSITIKHPEDFVNPKNWKMLTNGTVHNARRGEEKDEDGEECLLADLLITDAFAISLVKAGLREVSCGYEAEYEQTGKGKGKQTKLVMNHLALVEEGRAGSSYAIQDHNGKVTMGNKIAEKLKKLLGKTIDEAVAEGKKEQKAKAAKTTKAKDEQATPKASKSAGSETNTVMDSDAYDEMKEMYDALGAKLESMKPKSEDDDEDESEDEEEETPPKKQKKAPESEDEEEESEDEGEDTEILERVKSLEAAVAKLLESKDEDESEEEESEDEDESEEEESEDEDDLEGEEGEESEKKTGDAALVEILAPGFKAPKKAKAKDVKILALKEAYKTEEGRAIIRQLTGDKKPDFASEEKTSTLFVATAEILKMKRGTGLEKTKAVDKKPSFESFDATKEEMTAEKMNELNAAHWARK